MARCLRALALLVSLLLLLGLDDAAPASGPGRFAVEAAATDHPVASQVAADVLARGGSAADAAAAAMLALGVASPGSSGFGGGGFALYHRADEGSQTFLDFRERAPGAATADMFERAEAARPGSHPSTLGGLATGVPGEPAGIAELVRRFGRLPLAEVVAPAIALARRGVPASPYVRRQLAGDVGRDLALDAALRGWFRRGRGRAPERLAQPGLARALEAFAAGGADAIYRGAIARRIVADVRRHGGILTLEDLADYRVREREPLRATHFGHTFVTAPPPSAGGMTLLASLDFLERVGIDRTATPARLAHGLVESWKGPYLDRQAAFGDPDHVDVPLAELGSSARRAARAARFDPAHARAPSEYALPFEPQGTARTPDGGGTSHLCVVDRDGNVASVTTTVNLTFGARYTAGGILMNDEMDDFARAVGRANAFGLVGGERNLPGPGRRPVSSMTPTIVLDATGRPRLCVGAAGGSRIPTATEQVALAVLLFGASPDAAIAAPRIHHQAVPEVVYTERLAPAPEPLRTALLGFGHRLDLIDNVAVVQAIVLLPEGGLLGAADPRKGGAAAGR